MKKETVTYDISPTDEGDGQQLELKLRTTALGRAWVAYLIEVRTGGNNSQHRYSRGIVGRKCGELEHEKALQKALAAVGAEIIS